RFYSSRCYRSPANCLVNLPRNQVVNIPGISTLWLLYYGNELKPVLENSMVSILAGLSPQVTEKLVNEGLYAWYKNALDRLKERVQGARSADMDRGSRILAYHRLLMEYRKLAGVWAIRTSSAQTTLDMTKRQQALKNGQALVPVWTPHADVEIANKVLQHVQ
ncbi:hypothetical protein ACVW0P_004409, partial [Mucilaginibacter sp. UYNi724]